MHNERRRGKRPGHHDQVPATNDERRRGQRPGATITYLRCTTSGAAGDGLGTVIKYLRAAAGIGLGKHDQLPARRRRHWSWHHDQLPRSLDHQVHGAAWGTVGPIEAKVLEYGAFDGPDAHAVVGLVLGAFGELSTS
jgi:hypothetical protein